MKRKMFQKLMAVSLATAMTMSMAGCGGNDEPANNSAEPESTPAPSEESVEPTDDASEETPAEEVEKYTVLKDENGNVYDLGGMEIIVRDWWSTDPEPPKNDYEEARDEYHEWLQETYNFTLKQTQISDWASTPQDFVDYATTGGDENYIFVLRDDAITTGALSSGLMYDLATLDCLDFSEQKFQSNLLHKLYSKGDSIYCMAAGLSEPRTGMYFNKRILKDAGIEPDTLYDMQANGTWTWQAWTDMMDQIQVDKDNDGVPDIYGTDSNTGGVINTAVFSNGGKYIDKDADGKFVLALENPETKEALEWWVGILEKYTLPVLPEYEGKDNAWEDYKEAFKTGKVAFMPEDGYAAGPQAFLNDMEDEFGWVAFPKGPSKDDYTNVWSNNPYAIPACYDAEKAWKLAFAWNLWTDPIPGYEDYDAQKITYQGYLFSDTRAVDETYEILVKNGDINYATVTPQVKLGEDFAWNVYAGCDISAVIEQTKGVWTEYIKAANGE